MWVYMLLSAVQPLAKPKSQILMQGGWPPSSSVLSSFKSLSEQHHGQLVMWEHPLHGCGDLSTWHADNSKTDNETYL